MYYQGDYYRGDLFKTLAGGLVGGVKGFLSGGVTGAVRGAATGAVAANKPKSNLPMIAPTMPSNYINAPAAFAGTGSVQVPKSTPGAVKTPGLGGTISRILPGGQTGYELPLRGYHISKSGKIVKNRHMDPLNARALRRAVRREARFVAIARRVMHGSGYTVKRTGLPHGAKRKAR